MKKSRREKSARNNHRFQNNPASNIQGTKKQSSALRPPGSDLPSYPTTIGSSSKNKSKAELWITGGILAAASAMVISLFAHFRPFSMEDVASFAHGIYSYASERMDDVRIMISRRTESADETIPLVLEADTEPESFSETDPGDENLSYMSHSSELGDISEMTAEPVFPPQDAIYSCMLDTPLGPLLYYNQGDLRWKEYLYGGSDRLSKYGCGPVCVAMIINSFTSQGVTPIEMADWSAQNGYYARQSGSYHSLIPGSLSAFGLNVESVTDRTVENATELLRTGHILVALMGKGSLTQNGHFIIITQLAPSGNVYIADPASYENTTKEWDLQLLMDELKESYDSGAPLWAVSF